MDQKNSFIVVVWDFYNQHARLLPWREPELNGNYDEYKILVSEMMLQQTQVKRVIPKYQEFIKRFPSLESLAEGDLSEVLLLWSGLGYNRRAKYLHEAAKVLVSLKQPWSIEQLTAVKGIGTNTAAAICVYSYNSPEVFIETNIRTVYLHHFFHGQSNVEDKQIVDMLQQTIDEQNPREFYWALMDYGSNLKSQGIRNTSRSKHYKKQSRFEGSPRQIRGAVLRLLTKQGSLRPDVLKKQINDSRIDKILSELEKEKLIKATGGIIRIA